MMTERDQGMGDPYDALGLHTELEAEGLVIHGCDSLGNIYWKEEATEEQLRIAAEIKENHDPDARMAQALTLTQEIEALEAKGERMTAKELKKLIVKRSQLARMGPGLR